MALFEFRLIFPRFEHPVTRPRKILKWRFKAKELEPELVIKVMEKDRLSRDDKLGEVRLTLSSVPFPDLRRFCSKETLHNSKVNMFTGVVTGKDQNIPRTTGNPFLREISGFWPVTKRKILHKKESLLTGKLNMTLQLLTAEQADQYPGTVGNHFSPFNKYPSLRQPFRSHGSYRRKLITMPIRNLQTILQYIFSRLVFWKVVVLVVIIVVVLLYPHELLTWLASWLATLAQYAQMFASRNVERSTALNAT